MSDRRTEKRRRKARTLRIRGLLRTVPVACATTEAALDKKTLVQMEKSGNLGVRWHATFGMSDDVAIE
jgi:hypothetical protein